MLVGTFLSLLHFQRLQRTVSHRYDFVFLLYDLVLKYTDNRNYLHREIPGSYIVNRAVAEE